MNRNPKSAGDYNDLCSSRGTILTDLERISSFPLNNGVQGRLPHNLSRNLRSPSFQESNTSPERSGGRSHLSGEPELSLDDDKISELLEFVAKNF